MSSGANKSTKILIAENYSLKAGKPYTFHEVLRELYIDKGLSCGAIAKLYHVGAGTVLAWLREEGITTRKLNWK